MSYRPLRALAGLATVAVTAGLLVGAPASADPSPSSAAGASWLRADLETSGLFQYSFGGTDGGLNIDAGFALLEAGDAEGAAAQRERLAPETDGYITGDAFGDAGSTYANAVAKLLAFVVASGGDPTAYDGKDLVARLEAQVGDGTTGTVAGQIFDTSQYGDNTNVLGQAFAARALRAVDSPDADAVTEHLLAQQCADGHFPLGFRTSAKDTCTTDAANADVAALVVVNLRDQSEDPAVAAAVRKAAAFIASKQAADGSVGGAPPTDAANANTTGLAAWALGEACVLDRAYRAAAWTRALQVDGDQAGTPLADEVGAIAYDAAALQRDSVDGIQAEERDQYRRATAQAANALAYDRAATPTVGLTGPGTGGFLHAGSRVTLRVTGIDPGDAACLVTPGGPVLLDDASPTASTTVTLPRTTGTARYTATTGPGVRTVAIKVLAGKRLPITTRSQVRRGQVLRVQLKGLAAGESFRVLLGGKRIVAGKAGSTGRRVVRVPVTRAAGLGVKRVRVVGEFGDRVGQTTVRVLPAR